MKTLFWMTIWAGLLYLALNFLPVSYSSNANFLASSGASLTGSAGKTGEQRIISILGQNGESEAGVIHYGKSIDVSGIKVSRSNPGLLFAGTDHGLFVSRDRGKNWYTFSDIEHKINEQSQIYQISFSETGQAYVSVFRDNKGILYKSGDNFFFLDKILDWDGEAVYSFDIKASELFLGLSDGKLIRYSLMDNRFQIVNDLGSPITRLQVRGSRLYLTLKSGGFWVSEDEGKSFAERTSLGNLKGADNFKTFGVDPENNALIYAVTGSGLIKSEDSGNTWQVFKTIPAGKTGISSAAIDFGRREIYAASGNKLYVSGDAGQNWGISELLTGNREASIILLTDGKIIVGTKARSSLFDFLK